MVVCLCFHNDNTACSLFYCIQDSLRRAFKIKFIKVFGGNFVFYIFLYAELKINVLIKL